MPFRPDELSLHPTNPRVVVGLDQHEDSKPLYVSRNFGESWSTTQAHVNAFFWGVQPFDPNPLTLYIERKEPAASTLRFKDFVGWRSKNLKYYIEFVVHIQKPQ